MIVTIHCVGVRVSFGASNLNVSPASTNRNRVICISGTISSLEIQKAFIRSARYYDVISRTYDANIDSLFRQTALNLTQIGFAYFSRQCKFDTFVFSYLFIFFAFVLGFLFAS